MKHCIYLRLIQVGFLYWFCVYAHAATISVTTTADIKADDGSCSLREAIETTNDDASIWPTQGECGAGAGADTINIPAGTYTITQGFLPFITDDLEIVGAAQESTIINAGFLSNNFVVFIGVSLEGEGTFSLSDLTIQNTGSGKIALSLTSSLNTPRFQDQDTFTILRTKFSGHTGSTVLSVVNAKRLNIIDSWFSDNSNVAGAIKLNGGTKAFIQGTTFSNNLGLEGAAISIEGTQVGDNDIIASANVLASTFSNNNSKTNGGAINVGEYGFLSAINTTITENMADSDANGSGNGGGIFIHAGSSAILKSTVVANNSDSSPNPLSQFTDFFLENNTATIQSGGFNFIGSNAGTQGHFPLSNSPTTKNQNNDVVGSFFSPFNPLLAPLEDNGGNTPTRLPIVSLEQQSPVVDLGTCLSGFTYDQRLNIQPGQAFPETAVYDFVSINNNGTSACDTGAVELKPADLDFPVSQLQDDLCFPIKTENGTVAIICI